MALAGAAAIAPRAKSEAAAIRGLRISDLSLFLSRMAPSIFEYSCAYPLIEGHFLSNV
jgi:hypothetical protein